MYFIGIENTIVVGVVILLGTSMPIYLRSGMEFLCLDNFFFFLAAVVVHFMLNIELGVEVMNDLLWCWLCLYSHFK